MLRYMPWKSQAKDKARVPRWAVVSSIGFVCCQYVADESFLDGAHRQSECQIFHGESRAWRGQGGMEWFKASVLWLNFHTSVRSLHSHQACTKAHAHMQAHARTFMHIAPRKITQQHPYVHIL